MGRTVTISDRVKAALSEHGPMTAHELAEELNANLRSVQSAICRLRRRRSGIRIAAYRYDGVYPRALFELGAMRDAKRPPKPTAAENSRKYRERGRLRIASVFEWRGSL